MWGYETASPGGPPLWRESKMALSEALSTTLFNSISNSGLLWTPCPYQEEFCSHRIVLE